ncbi:hypothetical protein DUI87_20406 [Hirundo rustica rustica]|uniref:ribonuclease H n=1 Tax=Hirundo rustica rustica TaxID=333673 RepID=A0A3M0JQB2_HIRRU|nr:hypothetical protein DUI87_20406 [Hirundo rustica rustica]
MAEPAGPPYPAGPPGPHAAFFGPVARGNPVVDSFEAELRRVLSSLRRLRGAKEAKPPQHDLHRQGANTLFNIWIKYKPRLPEWYYNERLVEVGDTLAQIKEYKLALLQCYERYLQQFISVNLDDVMDDVHRFKSTFFPNGVADNKAVLTLSWPRTTTERLLVEMFDGAAAQFLAILEALSDSSRNLLPPHPPAPDEIEIRDVTSELFSAGLEILSGGESNGTNHFGMINPSSTLLQLMLTGEKGVSGDAAVKFVKLAFSYEEWDVFYSALEFVDNFLQTQDDPTWKKAEIELKLLTLMQALAFPGKFDRSFSFSDDNSKEASAPQGSERTQTIRKESLKPEDPFHDLKILATTVSSCVSTSEQKTPTEQLQIAYEILEKAINDMNTSRVMTLLPDGKSIFDNCCTKVDSNDQNLNSVLGCGDDKTRTDNGFVIDLHLELIQAQHRVAVKLLKITQGARLVNRSLKSSRSHEKDIEDFQYLSDAAPGFWAAATEGHPTQKLNWKTDSPVWVEQWLLNKGKLKMLQELVDEQLPKGHIVETTSLWNSLVFVIKKVNKGKWRLLHNLQINNVIEDMGSLQPGMQSLAMLPQNWNLAIIDIKDCFFQIPLHPDNAPCFAFLVQTLNQEAPRKRYHWKFLPQGMKNSSSICQWYLSSLLSPVHAAAGEAIILHYMDDVLVCAPNDDLLSHGLDLTIDSLVAAGFELQEEKIQRMPPWKYLGLEIGKRTIVPQKLVVKNNIRTLADVQQLCGSLNWSKRMIRPQELVAELIRKARTRIRELAGSDFECIHIPIEINSGQITKAMLEHLLHENEALQFALDGYTDQISIHWPAHKLFREQIQFKLSFKTVQSRRPLKAVTIFTDASGASHKSVITWKDPQTHQWEKDIVEVEGSPQVAELAAVVRAFEKFPEPFDLVTDSACVAGVVSRAEQAVQSEVSNSALFSLLLKRVNLISHQEEQFYVMHIRPHTDLPRFIAKGNRRADALAAPVEMAPLSNIFEQVKISHQLFHQA